MPSDFLIFLIFSSVGVSQFLLVLFFWLEQRKIGRKIDELNSPNKFRGQEYGEKGWGILHSAIKQSQSIVGQAELESVKTMADAKYSASEMEKKYEQELALTADEIKKAFLSEVAKASSEYKNYLTDLANQASEAQNGLDLRIKDKIDGLFDRFDQNLFKEMAVTSDKSLKQSELLLDDAKRKIEEYKKMKMDLLEHDISEIVERTTELVLGKKLSMSDQSDLIYESLERAKKEKLI